jgi:adenine-specific DNA-methyltransferase
MLGYIGSKKTLLPFLKSVIEPYLNNDTRFADLFAGTGIVGYTFKPICKNVIGNDVEYYSYVINYALLKCFYNNKMESLIQKCNEKESIENGLIYRNFAEKRMFFTKENAKKMDAVRQYLNELNESNEIDEDEYMFLLASLLSSIDKVANTASVYGAYLKSYKPSSKKPFVMFPIHKQEKQENQPQQFNQVYNNDVLDIITNLECDVVYLDPPYNSRQYGANYSPLNYIAFYDKNKEIKGKSGVLVDYFKSSFCKKGEIEKSLETTLKNIKASKVFISYNNEGLLSKDDFVKVCEKFGVVDVHVQSYKKFVSQRKKKESKPDENENTTSPKLEKLVQEYIFEVTLRNDEVQTKVQTKV